MSDELEIDCPKCRKCGQRMQDTMIIHEYSSFSICKCKNMSCFLKRQASVIDDKRNKLLEIKEG